MGTKQRTFNGPTSFHFSLDKEDQWWPMNQPVHSMQIIKRREEPVCNYTGEEAESKRFKSIGSGSVLPQLTSGQSSPLSLSTDSELVAASEDSPSMIQQTQISSTVTSTPISSTRTLPPYDPLDETRPLGLSLRKSQSLVDLIQQNLDQKDQSSVAEQALEENVKTKGMAAADSQQDKLKASNFPACYLKIGNWECSSIYEGDLVAKCYYAKRKLVWEVLDNGLKSKIEIQWSDITGLKANLPDKGPASLHIEISRTPLFFRETNPQPRKHTLWQSTSDFTGGQASIYRRHLLQFSEGVLNRHFEKLIQCDLRLKNLSEQTITFSGSPFFEGRILMLDIHQQPQFVYPGDISPTSLGSLQSKMSMPFNHVPLPIVKQNNVHLMEQSGERECADARAFSPSSVIDSRANDESSNSDTEELYARDYGRHAAGYRRAGESIRVDQRFLYGDASVSSTMGHSPSNVGPTNFMACSSLTEDKVSGGQILSTENHASLTEQNFLQRLSHHLFEDTLPEKFLTNGQVKEFSGKFDEDTEEKIQQRKLLSCSLSQPFRITNARTLGPSEPPFFHGLSENLGFPSAVKEESKCSESPFRPVKMENCPSSQLGGTMFSLAGNNSLGGGGPGMSRHGSFRDPQDMPQVPRFF